MKGLMVMRSCGDILMDHITKIDAKLLRSPFLVKFDMKLSKFEVFLFEWC
jgi:hypothetical protein